MGDAGEYTADAIVLRRQKPRASAGAALRKASVEDRALRRCLPDRERLLDFGGAIARDVVQRVDHDIVAGRTIIHCERNIVE